MKLPMWLLVLALAVSPCAGAKDKRSFWQRVFLPPQKSVKVKPKKRAPSKPKPKKDATKAQKKLTFVVDHEWMAHYWILENEWNYAIPEDKDIEFKDGKYHVPVVVYRHLEDMMEAKKAE